MSYRKTLFYGSVINPEDLTHYKALPRCLLAVNASGDVDWIIDDVEPAAIDACCNEHVDLVKLKDDEFIIPGFVDTHTVSASANALILPTNTETNLHF